MVSRGSLFILLLFNEGKLPWRCRNIKIVHVLRQAIIPRTQKTREEFSERKYWGVCTKINVIRFMISGSTDEWKAEWTNEVQQLPVIFIIKIILILKYQYTSFQCFQRTDTIQPVRLLKSIRSWLIAKRTKYWLIRFWQRRYWWMGYAFQVSFFQLLPSHGLEKSNWREFPSSGILSLCKKQ
jgi:hypothetical protein